MDSFKNFTFSNLQAIIDTVASIESVSNFGRSRCIKCNHCKSSMIEDNFYSRDQAFQDDVIATVEPGAAEVRSILCH